jgi:hypothetical protein
MFHDAIIGILGHSLTRNIDRNILYTSCCGACCVMSDIMDAENYIFLQLCSLMLYNTWKI